MTSKAKVYTYLSRYSLALGEINFPKYANKKKLYRKGSAFQVDTRAEFVFANLKHNLHADEKYDAAGNHVSQARV